MAGIDKLQVDVLADALKIPVVPDLEGEGGGGLPPPSSMGRL
jgi:hypothetical protein